MSASFEPIDVYNRHASNAIARVAAFSKAARVRGCALISVRHAAPKGEGVVVGSFAEIAESLREVKQPEVAEQLLARAAGSSTVIVVVQDLYHPPAIVEVPE